MLQLKEMKTKNIFLLAIATGLIAGILPLFLGEIHLITTTPIAMMIVTYWVAPRVRGNYRYWRTAGASLLSGFLALLVFFSIDLLNTPAAKVLDKIEATMWNFLGFAGVIAVAGTWFFLKTHDWAEKKRLQYEAKVQTNTQQNRRSMNATKPKKKYKKKKK